MDLATIGLMRTGPDGGPCGLSVWSTTATKRGAIAAYVALIDWTDRGVQGFKDSVDRYESRTKCGQWASNSRTSIGLSAATT
jgi:hypothetical protein